MTDTEQLAKGVVLSTLGVTPRVPTPAEKQKQTQIDRLTQQPAIKQEIEQMAKRLSRLPPAMQGQLAKKFSLVGESDAGMVIEGFDSVEDRDQWIRRNRKKMNNIWLMDTLEETESSKDSARMIIEHYVELGVDINQALSQIVSSKTIVSKHLRAALREMHQEGSIDLNQVRVKV